MLTRPHKTPIINAGDPILKRQEIKTYFNDTFELYESLFSVLASDNTFFLRPEPLRHPLIFYFGHTATFFVNKLRVSQIISNRLNPKLESMLAIGVDEMSWDDLNDAHYDWPSVEEVKLYRDQVKVLVNQLIDELPLALPIQWEDPFWIILMGIEHERIHLETSSVLIRQLPLDQVRPSNQWPICPDQIRTPPSNNLLPVNQGLVIQGRHKNQSNTYGWDNEFGHLETEVQAFQASQYLVSNAEYLQFVRDGGYEVQEWWTDEGWQWVSYKRPKHPIFWVPQSDGSFKYRAMLEEIEMPWSWPVDVNHLEAKAFCQWLSTKQGKPLRLPTEAEWYRLYDLNLQQDHVEWEKAPGNVNLEAFASSCPVNQFQQGNFYDIVGNVWQWTETPIDAFNGFEVHSSYDDFSVPTFDGKHNLIKGGSWISTGNESIRDSRYAFRRHFFQHAGFRYVESALMPNNHMNTYETDALISMYLEFHYGAEYFGVPNYPKACVEQVQQLTQRNHFKHVLDIGCATGRSSFELANISDKVDALDFSARFIRNAQLLAEKGQIRYQIPTEGELTELKDIHLAHLGLEQQAYKVTFSQGDACNLKAMYTGYDLVFAGNLIDRLYEPAKFLNDIKPRILVSGYLVLTSPYTWLAEFTDKNQWLGGFKDAGENLTTLEGLKQHLAPEFELIGTQDIPFVIRETARKHQHTVAEMSVWKKVTR